MTVLQKIIFILVLFLSVNLQAKDNLKITNPSRANFDKQRLQHVEQTLLKAIETKTIAGGQLAIWRKGHLAFHKVVGYSDLESSAPLQVDTFYRLLSMSSIYTAIAIMQLIEQGELLLSDSVSTIIPELKNLSIYQSNKLLLDRNLTILHLLLHTGGFTASSRIDPIALDYYRAGIMPGFLYQDQIWANYQTEQFLTELAQFPLLSKPGQMYRKSISYDLLGIIIERITGLTYAEYLSNHINKPLGLQDTGFQYIPSESVKLATLYQTDNVKGLIAIDHWATSQWSRQREMYSAGAGLVSTMRDMLELGKLLLNTDSTKRTKKNAHVLSDFSIKRLQKGYYNLNNIPTENRNFITSPDFLVTNIHDLSVGFSGWVVNSGETSSPLSRHAFVITSETGSFLIIDPKQELILVFLTQTIYDESNDNVIRLQQTIVETAYQAIVTK